MKALMLVNDGWPGVASNLNSISSLIKSKFADVSISHASISAGPVSFGIIRELKKNPPDFLFSGGWDSNLKTILQNASSKTKVFLQWCSPMSQTELGAEIPRFLDVFRLMQSGHISNIGIPVKSDYDILSKVNERFIYSPVFMDCRSLDSAVADRSLYDAEKVNCDIFCAACPRKNIFSQILSLHEHRHDIKLHLNFGNNPIASEYLQVCKNMLSINPQLYDWLSRDKYLSIIRSMDFSMQVSFSESFNYTAAEHMYFKIPVIISKNSPLARSIPPASGLNSLIVDDFTDVSKISQIVKRLVNDPDYRKLMGELSHDFIVSYNKRAVSEMSETLNDFILE